MKTAGKRKSTPIVFHASAEMLLQGALFNDETQKLFPKNAGFMKKGIYRYKSHEEANKHWDESLIKGIS